MEIKGEKEWGILLKKLNSVLIGIVEVVLFPVKYIIKKLKGDK